MIKIDGHSLDIANLYRLIFEGYYMYVDKDALAKVDESHRFLRDFAANKLIYGINTGFGPMAQYRIDETELLNLQYNIIRSHSSGMNEYLEKDYAKAVLINLLNSMLGGYSGVHTDLIHIIVAMIIEDITPCIPLHGGVGASGDLVQMAHVALNIIGEGEVFCGDTIMPAADAFRLKSINPLKISLREGIAIMNGTTAMTAVAALNVCRATIALEWSLALSACLNDMMQSYDDHYSERLNIVRQQSGQLVIAYILSEFLEDSKRIKSRERLYGQTVEENHIEDKVQPFYSLRCIPQILGPVHDTLDYARKIVENELNSTTDNPIVDVETKNVYHGGNFHGDYISLEMDKLKLVMTRVGMLAERQLNYLMNPAINGCLRPFLNSETLGLNFGFQGIQFTATSTAAENQALSTSNYVHSIPNNNDNQDIVSMGFNAACAAKKVIDNVFEILAIQAAAVIQGIDMLSCKDELSTKNQKIYTDLRDVFAPLDGDRATRNDLMKLKEFMMFNSLQIFFEK
ncbi:MAG: aromatic amino acid ammonia-lyase [Prevotellaceae bacterium]|jgi:histidine ammonia-lyase|nr:aromatic amino acid ammonia-lyase [Prevotellaceae bacterium]